MKNEITRSQNRIPLAQRQARLRIAGDIRLGEKNGNAPKRLETFRLTSASKSTLEALAEMYGAVYPVRPWANNAGQFEVVLQTSELVVRLFSPVQCKGYMAWDANLKLYTRSCDGVTCQLTKRDAAKLPITKEVPCMCNALDPGQKLDPPCKLTTEIHVVLDGLPSLGVWRLKSGGNNAFDELPGSVDAILGQFGVGARCVLRLETRSGKTPTGESSRFVVPCIDIAAGLDERVKAMGGVDLSAIEGIRTSIDMPSALEHSAVPALDAPTYIDAEDELPDAPKADSDGVIIEPPAPEVVAEPARPEIQPDEYNPFTAGQQPAAESAPEDPLDFLGELRAEFVELCQSLSANPVAVAEMARGRGLRTPSTILGFARKSVKEGAKQSDAVAAVQAESEAGAEA